MNLNADVRQVPWKKVFLVFVILSLVSGSVWGGWAIYKKSSSQPLSPLDAKELVFDYLEKKTGKSSFTSSFDITKDKKPWRTMEPQYDAPPDYKTVYRNIGEHLVIAEKLLSDSDKRTQYSGLRVILGLMEVANEVAVDPWLSARICEAYLIPLTEKTGDEIDPNFSREQLMHIASRAYREAGEDDRLIELGKAYLSKYSSSPHAENVRRQLGYLLRSKGRNQEAQQYLSATKNPDKKN